MHIKDIEKRKTKRSDIDWNISLWSPTANRFFNGKSINISGGGILIGFGSPIPVGVGQEVEINIPRTAFLKEQKGNYARIKLATVVRVDDEKVALQFTHPNHLN